MTTIWLILTRPLALDEWHGSCYDPRRYGDCTLDSLPVPARCRAGVLNQFATADPAPTARRRFLLGTDLSHKPSASIYRARIEPESR